MQRYKLMLILAMILIAVIILWIVPAISKHGIVTGKERIPQTVHRYTDGTTRTTPAAYFVTVQKRNGERKTYRVSEEEYMKTIVEKERK